MEGHCAKCGAQMESSWKFCPECGKTSVVESHAAVKHEPPEKTPLKGGFSGMLLGMVAVPLLVIVGTMLCLTGLGAILGIPMILAAVFAPLLGPMMGLGALQGKCPGCGVTVSTVAGAKDFNCHECGQRISIKQREFVAVE